MKIIKVRYFFIIGLFCHSLFAKNLLTLNDVVDVSELKSARKNLAQAIADPEYMLKDSINLPIAHKPNLKTSFYLSLSDAVLLALRFNPNIQSAELDRIIQKYQLHESQNAFEIQYALTGNASYNHSTISGEQEQSQYYNLAPQASILTPLGTQYIASVPNVYDGTHDTTNLQLELNQPLLRNFGKLVTTQGLADQLDAEKINKLNLKQSVIDQITTVENNYYALIQANNNVQTAKLSLQDARRTYQENEKRIKAGDLERTGNIQQAYQIQSLKLQLNSSLNNVKISSQLLLQSIGLDPSLKIITPLEVVIKKIYKPKLQKTIDYALAHNTSYLERIISFEVDKRALAVAKNQQLWELDLRAITTFGNTSSVGNNSSLDNLLDGNNTTQSIGVTLSVPIDDVGLKSQLINAKVILEQDRVLLAAQKRDLETTVTNTVTEIIRDIDQIGLAAEQLDLAKQTYEIEKKKNVAGISTSLDVTNTQNQLISAQNNLTYAKISYLGAQARLAQILGITLKNRNIKLRYQ